MAMSKSKCVICGKVFYIEDRRTKTCSEECRTELLRKNDIESRKKLNDTIRVCGHCRKEFHPTAYHQSYCTYDCAYKARREKAKANKSVPKKKKKKKEKIVLTDAKFEEIHKSGKTYAQWQTEQTVALYGRVNLW